MSRHRLRGARVPEQPGPTSYCDGDEKVSLLAREAQQQAAQQDVGQAGNEEEGPAEYHAPDYMTAVRLWQ